MPTNPEAPATTTVGREAVSMRPSNTAAARAQACARSATVRPKQVDPIEGDQHRDGAPQPSRAEETRAPWLQAEHQHARSVEPRDQSDNRRDNGDGIPSQRLAPRTAEQRRERACSPASGTRHSGRAFPQASGHRHVGSLGKEQEGNHQRRGGADNKNQTFQLRADLPRERRRQGHGLPLTFPPLRGFRAIRRRRQRPSWRHRSSGHSRRAWEEKQRPARAPWRCHAPRPSQEP